MAPSGLRSLVHETCLCIIFKVAFVAFDLNVGDVVGATVEHRHFVPLRPNVFVALIEARRNFEPQPIAHSAAWRVRKQFPPLFPGVLPPIFLFPSDTNLSTPISAVHAAFTRIEPRATTFCTNLHLGDL
jgi:hypothetical protein